MLWHQDLKQEANEKFMALPLTQSSYTVFEPDFSEGLQTVKVDIQGDAKNLNENLHDEQVKKYLGSVVGSDDKLSAFNLANFSGGIFIHVPKNETKSAACTLSATASSVCRSLVILERGAELNLFIDLSSTQGHFSEVIEAIVGEESRLNIAIIQDISKDSIHSASRKVLLSRNSKVSWSVLNVGSKLTKSRRETILAGEGSEVVTQYRKAQCQGAAKACRLGSS